MPTPETAALAGTAIDRLTPYLPGAAASREPDRPARAAAGALYDTVARRLRELGEEAALAEFVRQPTNDSLVRRLLATAAGEDPGFAAELAAAVRAVPPADPSPADPPLAVPPPAEPPPAGVAPVADRADSHRDGPRRRTGVLIGLAAVAVVLVLACLAGRALLDDLAGDGGLTARSSCAEFLRAPSADQSRAIEEIALAEGVPGLDGRLALPAVAHYCTGQPTARLGEVVAKLNG